MNIKIRRDLTSGIALMIFSAILWIMVPYHIVVTEAENNAQLFPRIIIATMFILALYIAGKALVTKKDKIIEFNLKKEGKMLLYMVVVVAYVFLIDKVGYLIATLFVSAVTLAVYKARKSIYVYMAIFVLAVYFLFTLVLGVPLP
ncbi:tripartite tricarboxylate transporter TctB family protein [Vallitalea okinawensis]|uniref:tripartite tricarboxylate transporter TctB family protein n=1 Tax=Vallitalea okinawensis TaxID=2078660 RepID=UPI000CFC8458|nr:tripartite tricarboxylate transporter TctB family protein [Vallitalea okinawensis]